jgi:heptosyltransferase I
MKSLLLRQPPASVCILRLSAVGDITHTLPIVRTLQRHWPQSRLTWVIGRTEHSLVEDIPGIEFIVFDKNQGWRAYRHVRQQLRQRQFDILLHMQMSLRASLIALFIRAPIKLGFDTQRASDLQWWFTTHRIPYQPNQHVIDSFFGFTEALGIHEHHMVWDIPIPADAERFAASHLPADKALLMISPCSSMSYRNWHVAGYVAVADYAATQHGMRVVLTGGPTAIERDYADKIRAQCHTPPLDLVGKTTLKQLVAVLRRARVVIAPDAGTAHLANAIGVPVISLFATTNPDRARPYNWPQYVVNKYPEAILAKFGRSVAEVPWGTRVRDSGTMDRITVMDVIPLLDKILVAP